MQMQANLQPFAQRFAITSAILARYQPAADPKLSELDLSHAPDLSTFMLAIEKQAGSHCQSIELIDDQPAYTTDIRLEFRVKTVCYVGGWERGEDGPEPRTETHTIKLPVYVKPHWTLSFIASTVASEVAGIENNRFA